MNGKISEHSVRPYSRGRAARADRHPARGRLMTALSRLCRHLRLARDRRRAVRAEMRRAEAERRAVVARLRHERTT